MTTIDTDELTPLSIPAIAKLTGFSSHTIRAAMDIYSESHGRDGLPFFAPCGTHRYARRDQLRRWFERLERSAACT